MNKKGQISVEFIALLGFALLFLFFVLNTTQKDLNQNRAILSIKSRTIDLINLSDSRAVLLNMDYLINEDYLEVTINIKTNGSTFLLASSDYSEVISYIKRTSGFRDVYLYFIYLT